MSPGRAGFTTVPVMFIIRGLAGGALARRTLSPHITSALPARLPGRCGAEFFHVLREGISLSPQRMALAQGGLALIVFAAAWSTAGLAAFLCYTLLSSSAANRWASAHAAATFVAAAPFWAWSIVLWFTTTPGDSGVFVFALAMVVASLQFWPTGHFSLRQCCPTKMAWVTLLASCICSLAYIGGCVVWVHMHSYGPLLLVYYVLAAFVWALNGAAGYKLVAQVGKDAAATPLMPCAPSGPDGSVP